MSTAPTRAPHRFAPALLLLGAVLQLLLVLVSPFLAFVSGMQSDACQEDCSFAAIQAGTAGTIGAALVVAIAVVVAVALLRRKPWVAWLPYAGIVLTLVLWWGASELTAAGLPGGALAP